MGNKLGEVSSITYGDSDDDYYYGRRYRRGWLSKHNVVCEDSAPMDSSPVDLGGSADVEVVWNLI